MQSTKDKPAIVIPLDGSNTATIALGAAQAMANIMEAILHIVHVTETMIPQDRLLKHLKVDSIPARDFVLHQVTGDVVSAILGFALSIDAKMIVMSSHGITYNPQHLLGGTAMGIIQHAPIPAMVVRPGIKNLPDATWRPAKMLVPLDGSPEAASAMDKVFSMAKAMGVDIDILHIAVVGTKHPPKAGTLTSPEYLDYPQFDWPAWAQEFIERFYAYHPPEVQLRLFHREGEPADTMLKFALEKGDDLIALSWLGSLEKERAATIKGVLQRTELPVLLIRSTGT